MSAFAEWVWSRMILTSPENTYRWPKNKIRDSVEYYLLRNTTMQLYGVYYLYFYTLYDLYIELCA